LKVKTLYYIITACLLINCKQAVINKVSITKKETYNQNFGVNPDEKITPTKIASFGDKTFYYFLNWEKQYIYSYEIETNALIKEIDISAVGDIISLGRITQVQWIDNEIIGVFSNDDQKIILIDLAGKIINQATTSDEESEAPYVSVSYFDRTFSYNQNIVYFTKAYTDFILAKTKDYKKYYSRPMILSINLTDKTTGHFLDAPYSYQKGNSYGDFDIFSCIGEDNQLVFSFPANDSLFIYKDNKLLKKVFASNSKKHEFVPYDVSKNKDLSLKRKYNSTKPFYQKIIYDSYRNLFFRVFKLESSYLDNDGKVKRDYSWSLVVLNNKFEIVGNLQFESKDYSPATIIPTKKGLIISSKIEKGIMKNYTLFNINIDTK
jgi:hypothetical protein